MVLGSYVPHIIEEHITGALAPLLAKEPSLADLPYRDITHWAIHPGGRSILDKVESKLELTQEQLVPARETLREYGNMSSATVLFVLKYMLENPASEREERICSMAFGPGLTVETGLFTLVSPAL
jgi:predicted naringenin-chalcone synthase